MMKRIVAFLASIFFANSVFATGYITDDVINGCSDYVYVSAYFEPHQHTCGSGYYLPANYDGCVACPSGATCVGGTFYFSDSNAQGIVYSPVMQNILHGCAANMIPGAAIFEPNQYTCDPGYYVPANIDGCVICPENNYCPGGTYTFNETETQGINACLGGLVAPVGMWDAAQCGHILHVGSDIVYLHSVKKTSPAVHVSLGNEIFYGNMTMADVPMNVDTTHKLKLQYNGVDYSVYDDTVVVDE